MEVFGDSAQAVFRLLGVGLYDLAFVWFGRFCGTAWRFGQGLVRGLSFCFFFDRGGRYVHNILRCCSGRSFQL